MFYRREDGSFRWEPADEDTLKGLKQWKQAYEERYMDILDYSASEEGQYMIRF